MGKCFPQISVWFLLAGIQLIFQAFFRFEFFSEQYFNITFCTATAVSRVSVANSNNVLSSVTQYYLSIILGPTWIKLFVNHLNSLIFLHHSANISKSV